MNKLVRGISMTAVLVSFAATAFAATPAFVPYQGRLTDNAGTPLSGSQTVVFSIYAGATGGTALYTETRSVTCSAGLFSAEIGSAGGTAVSGAFNSDLFNGQELYLGIKVGSDAEMTPRSHLGSVPYAMKSGLQPGIASYASGGSSVTSTTTSAGTDLVGITITTPASGHILVFAGGGFHSCGSVGSVGYAYVWIGESSGAGAPWYNVTGTYPLASTCVYQPVQLQCVYSKPAGTYSFYFQGALGSSTLSITVDRPIISAMFIPDALGYVGLPNGPSFTPAKASPVDPSGN